MKTSKWAKAPNLFIMIEHMEISKLNGFQFKKN